MFRSQAAVQGGVLQVHTLIIQSNLQSLTSTHYNPGFVQVDEKHAFGYLEICSIQAVGQVFMYESGILRRKPKTMTKDLKGVTLVKAKIKVPLHHFINLTTAV